MTKLYRKQRIWWISSWLPELIIKNSYLNNYLEKLFCQAYCFNFYSSQNTCFSSYNNIVLIFSLIRTAFLSIQKNIVLIFSLLKPFFFCFLLFCFNIYKMVDSEYSTDNYTSSKISIGVVIKNLEMLKFVPDHLRTKQMCKHALKRLPLGIRYVPDKYRSQQMCHKAILENGGTLESVPDCYKNQQMCDETVANYPHALKFVPDCYIAEKRCGKDVNTYYSTIQFVPD